MSSAANSTYDFLYNLPKLVSTSPWLFLLIFPMLLIAGRSWKHLFNLTNSRPLSTKIVEGSVYPYGIVEIQGRRPYMEDRHVVIPQFGKDKNASIYGVFDGHGGTAAAQFCVDNIGKSLLSSPISHKESPQDALAHAFRSTDSQFLQLAHSKNMDDGTTAIVMLVLDNLLTIANAGDSRAIIVKSQGKIIALSTDHKPDRTDERERIDKLGGAVIHWGVWRVEGVLAVSRAIGDRLLKEYVIPDPEVVSWKVQSDDVFVVIASDGLWDVVQNDEVGIIMANCVSAQKGAEALAAEAFVRGSADNVTVLVVDLRDPVAMSNSESSSSKKKA